MSGHFRCAAEVYRRAMAVESKPRLEACLGDSLLFAGQIARAKERFDLAQSTDDQVLYQESAFKSWLCEWLYKRYGTDTVPARAFAAIERLRVAGSMPDNDNPTYGDILKSTNAFDEVSNFNQAVANAQRENYIDALAGFAICALRHPYDIESWINAVKCSLNTKNPWFLYAILSCAIFMGGFDTYEGIRKSLLEQKPDEAFIEGLDEALLPRAKGSSERTAAHRQQATPFQIVADASGMTANALTAWLQTSHPKCQTSS